MVISDFSGGITDNIKLGKENQAERLDNFLISDEGGLLKRPGSRVIDNTNFWIPNNKALRYLIEEGDKFALSARHIYNIGSPITELKGPTNNQAFDVGLEINKFSHTLWQNHILFSNNAYAKPVKVYKDAVGVWQVRTAGLPRIDISAVIATPSAGAGANSYLYAFCYFYQYNVGSVVYEDFGGVEYVTVTSNGALSGANTVDFTILPVLANGTTLNYDMTTLKIYIYRTEDGGTASYKVGDVTNATTTFTDNMTDADLLAELSLYAQGGVLDNDEPPLAKYVAVVEGTGYYANIKEAGEEKGFRLRLSKTGDIDSCPEDSYKDFDSDITGLSYIRTFPIVFAKDKCWRVEGVYADDGSGTVVKTLISSTIGCESNNSIIQLDAGLVFASNQGFAYTDGYRAFLISDSFLKTYQSLIKDGKGESIVSAYDKVNGLVYWACASGTENDTLFVLDEKKGIRGESCFTTWSNPSIFFPTALLVDSSGDLIRGDKYGIIYKHDWLYRNDTRPEFTGVMPVDWSNKHIPYDYISTELFAGTKEAKKYGGKIMVRIKNISDVSVLVSSANNGYKNFSTMPEIRRRDGIIWGGRYIPWGTPGFEWLNTEDIEEIRYFPAGGNVRFYTKQVRISPAWTEIEKSDDRCTATVDDTATPMRVTLDTPADYDWNTDIKGYWIYFEDDDYVQGYEVTVREDGDNILMATPVAPPSGGSKKWRVMGYAKNELIEIPSYSIYTAVLGNKFKPYNTEDSGGNV